MHPACASPQGVAIGDGLCFMLFYILIYSPRGGAILVQLEMLMYCVITTVIKVRILEGVLSSKFVEL